MLSLYIILSKLKVRGYNHYNSEKVQRQPVNVYKKLFSDKSTNGTKINLKNKNKNDNSTDSKDIFDQ